MAVRHHRWDEEGGKVELGAQGAFLTGREIEALALRLRRIQLATYHPEAVELSAWFHSVASLIATMLTSEQDDFRLSTLDYASLHEMPARTVRYQCMKGLLPAIKDESGHWRIKVAA